jgi:hypothetical protein
MTTYEELEGIRQETVVIYSKVLSWHLCRTLKTAGASVEIFPSKDAGFMGLICYVGK